MAAAGISGAAAPRFHDGEEIPVLDFSDYFAGKPGAVDELARKLAQASETIGFYFLKGAEEGMGHVPGMMEMNRQLHNLPKPKRQAIAIDSKGKSAHGYLFGSQGFTEGDELEAVKNKAVGHDVQKFSGQGSYETIFLSSGHGRSVEDNLEICPAEEDLPGFFRGVADYTSVMTKLAFALLPVYARALGMGKEELLQRFQDPRYLVTLNHYAPRPKEIPDWNGLGMHADCVFFTLLAQDDNPGLQLMLPDGAWVQAPSIPGCFLVNTGEFLKRLTNGRWLNTVHKVVPPEQKDRYSVVFFLSQDKKCRMAPLPQFCSPTDPPRYEPFTYQSFYVSGETPYTVGARELESRRSAKL